MIIITLMYIPCSFIGCYLFVPKVHTHTHTHTHIYIYIYKYVIILQIASTCFGASAPSSGSFDIAFAEVIRY